MNNSSYKVVGSTKDDYEKTNAVSCVMSMENCPDMLPIYTTLSDYYRDNQDSCPTVILMDKLMEDISYIKCSDLLLLQRGTVLSKEIMTDNYSFRDSIHMLSFESNSFDIYQIAIIACNMLRIKCPQIILTDTLKDTRGESWQNSQQLTKVIFLKPGMTLAEETEVLLHELRHAWQHEKHQKKFFENYKFLDTGIDLKDYMMQPAEIDAEAFSVRVMVDLGFETYPVRRKIDKDLNLIIEEKAKRMCFPAPPNKK